MKLEDLAYAIAQKVFSELEHAHHFVVPEKVQKEIIEKVQSEIGSLIK